jgi:pyruvate dehydrogenase E1 component
MPDFWVPHGVDGARSADGDYQARFMRYLEDRGLKPHSDAKVWAFLGDGETDEPSVARSRFRARKARQPHLRRQLQPAAPRRPVRGNGQIIQERKPLPGRRLERRQGDLGTRMGSLLAKDRDGLLVKRRADVDVRYQIRG